jgi:3-hydroxyisobutyrate dehydrogenase-like beta-hydroxyacid dehydrogenase
MSTTNAQSAVGFIGPGDEGLPMATAIAVAGYPLVVWARHPGPLSHTSLVGGRESASERPWWRFWR